MSTPKHFPCPVCSVTVHPTLLPDGKAEWACGCGAAGTYEPSGDSTEDYIQLARKHRYDFGMHDPPPPIGNERVI